MMDLTVILYEFPKFFHLYQGEKVIFMGWGWWGMSLKKNKAKSKALHKRKCSPWLHAFPTRSNSGNFLIIVNQHPAWFATKPIITWDISTGISLHRIMLRESQFSVFQNISKKVVVTGILEFHEVSPSWASIHPGYGWGSKPFLLQCPQWKVSQQVFLLKSSQRGHFYTLCFFQ